MTGSVFDPPIKIPQEATLSISSEFPVSMGVTLLPSIIHGNEICFISTTKIFIKSVPCWIVSTRPAVELPKPSVQLQPDEGCSSPRRHSNYPHFDESIGCISLPHCTNRLGRLNLLPQLWMLFPGSGGRRDLLRGFQQSHQSQKELLSPICIFHLPRGIPYPPAQ